MKVEQINIDSINYYLGKFSENPEHHLSGEHAETLANIRAHSQVTILNSMIRINESTETTKEFALQYKDELNTILELLN